MDIIEQWKNAQKRNLFKADLAKELSKLGDLSAFKKQLNKLGEFLDFESKYDLYMYLLDTRRPDAEW